MTIKFLWFALKFNTKELSVSRDIYNVVLERIRSDYFLQLHGEWWELDRSV